ncbi:transglutaminase domain-containing protein [Mucilaginibacter sp. UYCu711]|uniref:transglutaminase domain-containing protein n=1 Tax=Mucilaginibacter sp. UYCu711 TaxID=3156339 RepID=UPI003D19BEFE
MKSRFTFIVISFLLLVVMYAGYLASDDRYYTTVISGNNLQTPQDVFEWTTKKFSSVSYMYHSTYASPKYLMQNHTGLWCDEGAIVMATLDHKLGYKTRLVDLIGYDNVAHHTLLQVYENNKWVNYDFTFRLNHQAILKSSYAFNLKMKEARPKTYPKLYNFIVNNNFFAKKVIFALRGIREKEPTGGL